MKDYIVVGAGLSGLQAAQFITEKKWGSVLLLEKSRGVGGRMATRRTLDTRFDHGAQFYRNKEDIAELHTRWSIKQLTHQWFKSDLGEHWCASAGMTALAKNLAEPINIKLEKLISKISYEGDCWSLTSDKEEKWYCKNLILSAPLPQSLAIIERSNLGLDQSRDDLAALRKIQYSKAVLALVVLEEDLFINKEGYKEFTDNDFFSIADQKQKGVSSIAALTITMSAEFSEKEFEQTDEIILNKILAKLQDQYPQVKLVGAELKKWRYCQVLSRYKDPFLELLPRLYLIGDAFGGPSLLGALRSSFAVCEAIQSKNNL